LLHIDTAHEAYERFYSYDSVIYKSLFNNNNLHGIHKLTSDEAPQQADLIGPLVFCNKVINALLVFLQYELPLGYLNYLTLKSSQVK